MKRDIVDYLKRQQTRYERHDECGCCDLEVCAAPLDALLVLFGELLREPPRSSSFSVCGARVYLSING